MENQLMESNEKKTEKNTLLGKINTQINEERLFKDLSGFQLNRISTLKTLAESILSSDSSEKEKLIHVIKGNLKEHTLSIVSLYLLGYIELQTDGMDTNGYIQKLLEEFVKISKWPIVDNISDLLLEKQETHKVALRYKVESVGHLKGKKEARPYLEKLAQNDKKNPDVAKRYALSIIDEDLKSALEYLMRAGESYARLKDYKNLEDIWMLVVQHEHKNMTFFERIERILVGDRQKVWIASHLSYLIEPFRSEENWDTVIHILKKVLYYEPHSTRSRSDLVRAYRSKYEKHTLLNEFLKISDLTNHKRAVEPCIANFERNIVFDLGNYVYHRTRGVGRITKIDSEQLLIDFSNNTNQSMSVQMAIHSLQPLQANHIWARHYENPKEIEEIFKEDTALFIESLLSSFNNKMTMLEIKNEVVGRLLKPEEWTKWWTKARNQIKKDPRYGFNPNKKDELLLRDIPMTLTEELSLNFQSETDWSKKIEIALTALKDADTEGATMLTIQYYKENEKNKDPLKRLHSHFFLNYAEESLANTEIKIQGKELREKNIKQLILEKSPEEIQNCSLHTSSLDFKKDLVTLIIKERKDYPEILKNILFELPIKVHKTIISELMRLGREDILESFVSDLNKKYREHPEIFLWMARNILTASWAEYNWVKLPIDDVMLQVFRLLKPLNQIEKNSVRLKNMALDIICGTKNLTVDSLKKDKTFYSIIQQAKPDYVKRLYAIFQDVPYIPEAHKENMRAFFKEVNQGVNLEQEDEKNIPKEDGLLPTGNTILSSSQALEKRRQYLDHLIHIEMPANSRDIGEAQEKGDLRENSEYKAAMEKQSQLQAEISKISKELQRVQMIRPSDVRSDVVSIGARVLIQASENNEKKEYIILGPWDADPNQNIISYESPLARVLLGKKLNEKAQLESGQLFTVLNIQSALI